MKVFYVLCISVLVLIACSGGEDTSIVEQGFTRAEQQLYNQLKAVPEATEYPRTIGKDGKLKVKMTGRKVFIPVVCGMYMNIPTKKIGKKLQ